MYSKILLILAAIVAVCAGVAVLFGALLFLTAVTAPSAKAEDSMTPQYAATATILADGWSSYEALKSPDNKEGNPAYGDHPTVTKMLLITGARISMVFIADATLSKKDLNQVAWCLAVINGAVVVNNVSRF